jgi:hypothetical protein
MLLMLVLFVAFLGRLSQLTWTMLKTPGIILAAACSSMLLVLMPFLVPWFQHDEEMEKSTTVKVPVKYIRHLFQAVLGNRRLQTFSRENTSLRLPEYNATAMPFSVLASIC